MREVVPEQGVARTDGRCRMEPILEWVWFASRGQKRSLYLHCVCVCPCCEQRLAQQKRTDTATPSPGLLGAAPHLLGLEEGQRQHQAAVVYGVQPLPHPLHLAQRGGGRRGGLNSVPHGEDTPGVVRGWMTERVSRPACRTNQDNNASQITQADAAVS